MSLGRDRGVCVCVCAAECKAGGPGGQQRCPQLPPSRLTRIVFLLRLQLRDEDGGVVACRLWVVVGTGVSTTKEKQRCVVSPWRCVCVWVCVCGWGDHQLRRKLSQRHHAHAVSHVRPPLSRPCRRARRGESAPQQSGRSASADRSVTVSVRGRVRLVRCAQAVTSNLGS